MPKFDPYEILGVERDADDEKIQAAARRAAKKTHPDAGGDAAAFQDTRRALALLMDTKKRKHFDATGEAEEIDPDNSQAAAMAIIEGELARLVNAYLANDFHPMFDPRKIDLVEQIEEAIKAQISNVQSVKRQADRHVKFLVDIEKRFTRKKSEEFNFISRRIADQKKEVEKKIGELVLTIENLRAAADMIRTYDFRFDPPAAAPDPFNYRPGSFFENLTRR